MPPDYSNTWDNANNSIGIQAAQIKNENPNFYISTKSGEAEAPPRPTSKPDLALKYVDRNEIQYDIRRRLVHASKVDPGVRRLLVHGIRGIGKTQLCVKIFDLERSNYPERLWADAGSRVILETNMRSILSDHGLDCTDKCPLRVMHAWLAGLREPWLLVLDNVGGHDDYHQVQQAIRELIPRKTLSQGSVLLNTSIRDPNRLKPEDPRPLEIPDLDKASAITILKQATPGREDDLADVRKAVSILCYHPLAIEIAGAYLAKDDRSISEFMSCLQECPRDLLAYPLATRGCQTVYQLMEWTVDKITRNAEPTEIQKDISRNTDVRDMLRLLSFYHPERIPRKFLQKAQLSWAIQHGADLLQHWDRGTFISRALFQLEESHIIKINDSHITMHGLVHMWARDQLFDKESEFRWSVAALSVLGSAIDEEQDQSLTQPQRAFHAELLPHVEACLHHSRNSPLSATDRSLEDLLFETESSSQDGLHTDTSLRSRLEIASRIHSVYLENLQGGKAKDLAERILRERQMLKPLDLASVAASMAQLATSLHLLGKYSDALQIQQGVIEHLKKEQPVCSRRIALAKERLASTHATMSNWKEAVRLEAEVLDFYKQDPEVNKIKLRIASRYFRLGDRKRAEDLRLDVLRVQSRELFKNNEITMHGDLDLVEEVLRILNSSQEIWEKDKDSISDVLDTLEGLASDFSRQNSKHREKALELRKTISRIGGSLWPQCSRRFLIAKDNLGLSLCSIGQIDEAMQTHKAVLNMRESRLGVNHPDTLLTQVRVATCYQKMELYDDAIPSFERCLEGQMKLLNSNHEQVLQTRTEIARTYFRANKHHDALKIRKKLDIIFLHDPRYGKEHHLTMTNREEFAQSLMKCGDESSAVTIWKELAPLQDHLLGPDHTYSLETRYALAQATKKTEPRVAEENYRHVIRTRVRYGIKNICRTLEVLIAFRRLLVKEGRADEAKVDFDFGFEALWVRWNE